MQTPTFGRSHARTYSVLSLLLLAGLLLAACGGGAGSREFAVEEAAPAEDSAAGRSTSGDTAQEGAAAPVPQTQPAANEASELSGAPEPEAPAPEEEAPAEEAEIAADEALDDDVVGAGEELAPPPPTPAPTQEPPVPEVEVEVNPFTLTSEDNLSTFAMDVDTASYSAARGALNQGMLPHPNTVRVEEFVNYFRYGYADSPDDAFAIALDAAPSPFGGNTQLVRVGIQGQRLDESERQDAVLTFVIDVSGSMNAAARLPLVKQALTAMVENLRDSDTVAIVVYSNNPRAVLEPTPVSERDTIITAINSLSSEGGTNLAAGLRLGYQLAGDTFEQGAINRVIICSDGLANIGSTTPEAILQEVRDYASQGIYLTTVGFGMTYNDQLMEQIANDGNGFYAYVDTLAQARRVFVEDLTGTLQVIAQDAKVQVEFNPDVVRQYRLLGYENRAVADEDFRDDSVDAGEIGAGHSVTALYEVVLTGQGAGDALVVSLRYEDPDEGEVYELKAPLADDAFLSTFDEAPANFRLAVAAAGFAENLRQSAYAQDRPLSAVLEIAEGVAPDFANDDDVQEFVHLIRQAEQLSQ